MRRPKIGLIADVILREGNAESLFHADYVTDAVSNSILEAGGLPFVVPILKEEQLDDIIPHYLAAFDGFYFVGGADIDPQFYGEAPRWTCGTFDTEKDRFELTLMKAAFEAGKAIFANCRGMQVVNVALGGTLHQDLQSASADFYIKHENLTAVSPAHLPTHYIQTVTDSALSRIIGEQAFVNSRHHQGVNRVATPLKIAARSEDGVIEALESVNNDQVLAVQWHPENLWPDQPKMLALYQDFIRRVRERMED